MRNLSRREFLKGSAASALSLATVSMLGACAKTEENTEATESVESTDAPITISETREADVAIVGGGAAGLLAGYNLTKAGKRVIILEKGMTSAMSNFSVCGGPAAADSGLQKEAGVDCSLETVFTHMAAFANQSVNLGLLYNVLSNTGEAIDDMTSLGIPLFVKDDTYGVGFQARHMFQASGDDRVGPLVNFINEHGGEFIYGTPGKELVYEDGKVSGVLGLKSDNTYVQINAKAVVVCTGGFQGNPEMMKRFMGGIVCKSLGFDTASGDGISMCESIGAVIDRNFALLGNEGAGSTTKIEGALYNFAAGKMPNSNLAFALHGGLLVDASGDRFCNEKDIADFPLAIGGELFARAGKTYAIIDQATFTGATTIGTYAYLGNPENWIAGKALWFPVLSDAEERLEEAVTEGWAYKSDSIADIAAHWGLEDLEDTVAEYNAMCANGKDTKFHKASNFMNAIGEGPYYSYEYEPGCWSTNGGIKTDTHLRAIGDNSEYIPGLYIAGVDNGSMYNAPYYDNEGASVGLAIGSGVLVAKEIIKQLGK